MPDRWIGQLGEFWGEEEEMGGTRDGRTSDQLAGWYKRRGRCGWPCTHTYRKETQRHFHT